MIANGRQRVLDLVADTEDPDERTATVTQLLVDAVSASLEQRARYPHSPYTEITMPVASELITNFAVVTRAAIEYCSTRTGLSTAEIVRDLRGWFLDDLTQTLDAPDHR